MNNTRNYNNDKVELKGEEKWRGKGRGERNCLDWTQNTRNTDWVIKWVIVRIAAYFCASLSQIWIPEIEYSQKVSSHAQIRPQGAEKQQRKVYVGGWYGVITVKGLFNLLNF